MVSLRFFEKTEKVSREERFVKETNRLNRDLFLNEVLSFLVLEIYACARQTEGFNKMCARKKQEL